MRTPFRLPAVTLVLAAALAVSGCTPDKPAPVPSVSQSGTPLFASDEEALAAAEEAYAAYLAMTDELLGTGDGGIQGLETVAIGRQLQMDAEGISGAAELGYRSVGRTTFGDVSLQSYRSNQRDGQGLVVVYLCEDVSAVDVIDQSGVSVVRPDRPEQVRYEVTFDAQPTGNGGLLVSLREPWGDGAC